MAALIIVLTLVALSILVTRVVTKALVLTGLSEQAARFQARSVFTGTGYTTEESESIVKHPVRRRIIMWLMIAQSAGLVSVISMLILSFIDTGTTGEMLQRGGLLVGGLLVLIVLSRSETVEAALERAIDWALENFSDLKVRDYYTLLHLGQDYSVQRFRIDEDSWLADKTLDELGLVEEGILLLSLERNGEFMGAPGGELKIEPGDQLTMYGEKSGFDEFHDRLPGEEGDQTRRASEQEQVEKQSQEKEPFTES